MNEPLPEPGSSTRPSRHFAAFGSLRTYFLTGLVIAAPIAITISLTLWFVRLFDTWVTPWIPDAYHPEHYLPFTVPGLGLLVVIAGLTIIGALAANFLGRALLGQWEGLMSRMPVVRSVYKALKQIFETVISPSGLAFQQVGLIEFPRAGLWTLVFVTRAVEGEVAVRAADGAEMLAVYVPTTPNPTGGYVVFVRRSEVQILDMSVEEGMKAVVSLGLVMPDPPAAVQPAAMRRTASSLSKR